MRRYLAAMESGDREAAFAFYADDLVAHVPGRSALAGVLRGREAFAAYVREVVSRVDDIELELVDMLAGAERVALLLRERLRGPTGEIEIRRANVYRIRDGRIAEIWIHEADQYAIDEFLAASAPAAGDAFGAFERTGWNEGRAAPYHHAIGELTARSVEALLDAAGVGPRVRVLDVATGPGYAAGRAAARGADAFGVAFSAEMVTLAAELHPGVEFLTGDANALPFADASFDAVVANFLMPHVADLPEVVRELARVVRPGGRVALSTWDPEPPTYLRAMFEVFAAAGAVPAPELPPGPSFFQYAAADEFRALLAGAGLDQPVVESVPFTHRIDDVDAFIADLIAGTVRMGVLLQAQPADVQARFREGFSERLKGWRGGSGYELPCAIKVGSGRRA